MDKRFEETSSFIVQADRGRIKRISQVKDDIAADVVERPIREQREHAVFAPYQGKWGYLKDKVYQENIGNGADLKREPHPLVHT
ncbi:hypothetical protein NPIL_609361 [Nephila pilipes]|uniref:Uncharacterized protein n=1 Tax=Nephila pilipes TaxID=299642 RepID=A0A8X6IBP4_NEPPI|nr:hypothetical protein NPIL_609361 [Nephila pilipes]